MLRYLQSCLKYYCYHQNAKEKMGTFLIFFYLKRINSCFIGFLKFYEKRGPLFYLKVAFWISSNIVIAILNFSLLLPLLLSLFQLSDSKVVTLNPFASFLYKFCRLVHGFFSVLLPIQLSLFQLLRQQQVSLFYALKGVSEE